MGAVDVSQKSKPAAGGSQAPKTAAPKAPEPQKEAAKTSDVKSDPAPAATQADAAEVSNEAKYPETDYRSTNTDMAAVVRNDDKVERNQNVTDSYHEISQDFDDFLNPPGKEDAGNNWFDYAKWASREVGDGIQGKDLPTGSGLTDAQDILSEGNTKVYDDIAPDAQAFLKEFGQDQEFDQAKYDEWSKRFGDDEGGQLKKDAFGAYYEARFEDDPKKRQELTLLGNLKIAEHEQKLLDPVIDKAFDPVDNSGWLGTAAKIAGGPVGGFVVDKLGEQGARIFGNPDIKVPDGQGGFANPSLKDDLQGQVPGNLQDPQDPRLQEMLSDWGADTNSLEGTGAGDWSDLDQRMKYISQMMKTNANNEDLGDWNPQAGVDRPAIPRVADEGPLDIGELTGSLSANFGFYDNIGGGDRDGKVSVDDLTRAADDPNASPEARETAAALLRNEALLNGFDTASGGDTDGTISLGDLDNFKFTEGDVPTTADEARNVIAGNSSIFDVAGGQGDLDGKYSQDDLRAILNSPDLPPELKQAATLLLA